LYAVHPRRSPSTAARESKSHPAWARGRCEADLVAYHRGVERAIRSFGITQTQRILPSRSCSARRSCRRAWSPHQRHSTAIAPARYPGALAHPAEGV